MEKPILKHSNLKREDMKELLEGYPDKRSQGDLTEDEMNELICLQNTDKFHEELRKGFDLKKKDMKPRIYISGPISGHDIEERRRAFKIAQMRLSAEGWEVFNPMENGLLDSASTHEHMKVDIRHLLLCDSIYMMKRWTHSKGCKVEFDVATAIGLDVYFEESAMLIKFE